MRFRTTVTGLLLLVARACVCVCVFNTNTGAHGQDETANKKRYRKDAISFGGGRGARCSSKNYVAIIPAMGWIYYRFIVVVVVLCMCVVTKVTEQRHNALCFDGNGKMGTTAPLREKTAPDAQCTVVVKIRGSSHKEHY